MPKADGTLTDVEASQLSKWLEDTHSESCKHCNETGKWEVLGLYRLTQLSEVNRLARVLPSLYIEEHLQVIQLICNRCATLRQVSAVDTGIFQETVVGEKKPSR